MVEAAALPEAFGAAYLFLFEEAKMRAGDVLGALTGDIGLDGADIGKIAVHPAHVYVAVRQGVAHKAFKQLQNGKIKGKACRVRLLK